LVLIISTASIVCAIPVGKFSGRVTDENGVPLKDVTILLDGTDLNATTDSDGNYVVLQVPPGTYGIVARRAGFRHIRKPAVAVYADRTVRVDFSLPLAGIEIETETVPTDPPLITPDVTSTRSYIDLRQYRRIPTSSIVDVLAFESGVRKTPNNELAIRGFHPNEVVFQIDGFTWMNPLEGRPYSEVNVAFIEQVQIVSGAYVAGKPGRGAIINIVTRDPANMATLSGDARYTLPHRKHFGPDAYGSDQYDRLLYLNAGTSTGGRLTNQSSIPPGGPVSGWDVVDSDKPVYRVQSATDALDTQPVFVGWIQATAEVNAGTRALGDSLIDAHRGSWTPETLKQVWSHRHRAWSYADRGDLFLDLALASPSYLIPRTNFAAGYRHNRTVLPVPAVVQDYTNRALTASLHSRVIPRVTIDGYGQFEMIETTANGVSALGGPGTGTGVLERFVGVADPMAPAEVYESSPNDWMNTLAHTLDDHGGPAGLNKYNLWANDPYTEQLWGGGLRLQHRVSNRVFYGISVEHLRATVEMKPAERRGSNSNGHRTDRNFETVSLGGDDVAFLDESPWGFDPGSYAGLDVVGGYYLSGGGY
ncbi:MAG TPA: TonB-dependent receptor, partial [Firmicutes bacterium]|nr:TonB-dependent receptor [Bacillota bacterium]